MHIYFSEAGAAHFYSACAAIALGFAVLLLRKGTRAHRAIGLLYGFTMLSVNASALMLYHLTGHFGVFHFLALISLFCVVWGVSAAIFRWKSWLNSHYRGMSFSYLGLLAAACAEAMVRVPALHVHTPSLAIAIGVGISFAFALGGGIVINRLKPRVLANFAATS